MSNNSISSTVFENPDNKPLEELYLRVRTEGVTEKVLALDKRWIEKKYFINYKNPELFDTNDQEIIGGKETWIELATFIIDDLSWLLKLPFYRFWSNVVYNSAISGVLNSFLANAPTFYCYEKFPNDPLIRQLFDEIRKNVLKVFARIITPKENASEYMSQQFYGSLLYNEYVITIPTLLDLCQQYARDNKKIVEKIVSIAFTVQPKYMDDMEEAREFFLKALRTIEQKFEDCPIDQIGKAVPLTDRGGARMDISEIDLEDHIIYLLDMMSTLNIFINVYPKSACKFHNEDFLTKIVLMYSYTIPQMYQKLENVFYKDELMAQFMEMKHYLDVSRIEMIELYRQIIFVDIRNLINEKDSLSNIQKDEIIDNFLSAITNSLAETEFFIDYNRVYPFINDYGTLNDIHPELDSIKCQFIIQSIDNVIPDPPQRPPKSWQHSSDLNLPSTSRIEESNAAGSSEISNHKNKSVIEIQSLIYNVKDILCDLGEGFIQKCLEHYNFESERVINAVLEGTLPPELEELDRDLPFLPPDPEEALLASEKITGLQRLNVFDNDEFDIMTRDTIDTSKMHKGKKKDKYKNLNDLLNDKTHLKDTREIYHKFSTVDDYDDEYDDTYDDYEVVNTAQDDVVEVDARAFTVPRVLQKKSKQSSSEDEEDVEEVQERKDQFVQDPALLRAKAEERRLNKQKSKAPNKNVAGAPKGQGQSKEVLQNRDSKNKNKSTRANHNRRAGSQWKKNQGMVPS